MWFRYSKYACRKTSHDSVVPLGLKSKKADFRSRHLHEETRCDLASSMCNQTIDELCDKVKSRGDVGCGKPAHCFIKVSHKSISVCSWVLFFSIAKSEWWGGDKKKLENWNLTCLVLGFKSQTSMTIFTLKLFFFSFTLIFSCFFNGKNMLNVLHRMLYAHKNATEK